MITPSCRLLATTPVGSKFCRIVTAFSIFKSEISRLSLINKSLLIENKSRLKKPLESRLLIKYFTKKRFSFDVVIKSPPVYAIIVSVIFLYFQIKPPLFLENTTFLLTYATIFLVLMSLGIALTKFKFSLKDSVILSLCRVILGPLIAFIIIYNFDLTGFAAGVLLIQSAMPSAILNYLVGSMYSPKKVIDSIASTIVVSTVMSFFTIPMVVFFALKYFN